MKHNSIFLLFLLFLQPLSIKADPLSLEAFLAGVQTRNIRYLVEKYQVDIAQAKAKAARVFPDPALALAYSNNQDRTLQMGKAYEMEVSYTLELGGKRSARMRVAQGEKALTEALVEDFFVRLRAEATLAYYRLAKEQLTHSLYTEYYRQLTTIAEQDSLRYSLGDIMETDAKQSKVEKQLAYMNLLQKANECRQLQTDLEAYQGQAVQEVASLERDVTLIPRAPLLSDALKLAEEYRMDVRIALKNRTLSDYNLRLAKANRALNVDLSLGLAHNTIVNNTTAPAPSYNSISAGIGIPLQFSRLNRGEIQACELERKQKELEVEALLLQVRKETTQAYWAYETAQKQLNQFRAHILQASKEILDKKNYRYTRGEISWLEWVSAQHAYQETFEQYYETLYHCMESRVALQLATGHWE